MRTLIWIPLFAVAVMARAAQLAVWAPRPEVTAVPSPTPQVTATAIIAAATSGEAWLNGDRVLVIGAALDLTDKKDATRAALKDAADKASDFLERQGWEPKAIEVQGVEDSLLRETPLRGKDLGDVRIEDAYQERWVNEAGEDRWSVHVTLSIRLGKRKKG